MPRPATAAIERLVRQDLGCTCPPQVFERIEAGSIQLPGLSIASRRLAIGGRLLVYVLEPDDVGQALAQLPLWVAAGRADRDAAGMNRFRLVTITPDPASMDAAIRPRFDALPDRDERTHLHVLSKAAVAGI
jgi:hypothetical protein